MLRSFSIKERGFIYLLWIGSTSTPSRLRRGSTAIPRWPEWSTLDLRDVLLSMGRVRCCSLVQSKKKQSRSQSAQFDSADKSYSNSLILAQCMKSAGIRAFVGKLSMDRNSRPTYIEASAEDALSAAASFVDKCISLERAAGPHERLVEPVLTPRFVPTCSHELLVGLGRLSEERGLRVQSHMAEALDQVQWVRQERGLDDIEVFERVGMLTPL